MRLIARKPVNQL